MTSFAFTRAEREELQRFPLLLTRNETQRAWRLSKRHDTATIAKRMDVTEAEVANSLHRLREENRLKEASQ